jgi:radical SAM protein with 4Fe4S-binding SPASM domain
MLKFPIGVEIDLTYKCNYKCIYCRNGLIKEKGELDFEAVRKIIEEAKKFNIFHIGISGGEPTLYSHFEETIKYLGKMDITWNLATNGSLFNSELTYLLKLNNVNSVFITLTGMLEKTDNRHRQVKNSLEKALNAIDLCIKENIKVTVGYLLTSLNINEIDLFINFIKEKQIKAKLMKVKHLGTSLHHKHICIDQATYNFVQNKLINDLDDYLILGEQSQKIEQLNCMAGKTDCVIGADYNVYPCIMFLGEKNLSCGSIKDDTLYNIWNKSALLSEFRQKRVFVKNCERCGKKTSVPVGVGGMPI